MRIATVRSYLLAAIAFAAAGVLSDQYIRTGQRVVAVSLGNANMNSPGWLQFCGASMDINAMLNIREPNADRCVSIRPISFAERDGQGQLVTGENGAGASVTRFKNELYYSMTVGHSETATLPACEAGLPNHVLCGNTNPGNGALRVQRLPISIDLSSIGKGTINFNASVFLDNGVVTFDGRTTMVEPGSAKFDLGINNYSFAATGTQVSMRFRVSSSSLPADYVSVAQNSSGYPLINGNDIEAYPRYAVEKTYGAYPTWYSAAMNRVIINGEGYVEMSFTGSFVHMEYDAFVGYGSPAQTPSPKATEGVYQLNKAATDVDSAASPLSRSSVVAGAALFVALWWICAA